MIKNSNKIIFIFFIWFAVAACSSYKNGCNLIYKKGVNHSDIGIPSSFLLKTKTVNYVKDTIFEIDLIKEKVTMKAYAIQAEFCRDIGEYKIDMINMSTIDTIYVLANISTPVYQNLIKYAINETEKLISSGNYFDTNVFFVKKYGARLLFLTSDPDNSEEHYMYFIYKEKLICFRSAITMDLGKKFFRAEGLVVKTATSKINTSFLGAGIGKDEYKGGFMVCKDETLKWLKKELKKTNLEGKYNMSDIL